MWDLADIHSLRFLGMRKIATGTRKSQRKQWLMHAGESQVLCLVTCRQPVVHRISFALSVPRLSYVNTSIPNIVVHTKTKILSNCGLISLFGRRHGSHVVRYGGQRSNLPPLSIIFTDPEKNSPACADWKRSCNNPIILNKYYLDIQQHALV